jgi:hypothetical protein
MDLALLLPIWLMDASLLLLRSIDVVPLSLLVLVPTRRRDIYRPVDASTPEWYQE